MARPQLTPRGARPAYEGARVGELGDPLLPRWFVLLMLILVPVTLVVGVTAFVVYGPEEVPVAERRPVPDVDSPLSTDVGEFNVGDLPAQPISGACPLVEGTQAAGTLADQARIAAGLNALCEITVPGEAAERLAAFRAADGVIRFAQFERTGVDSAYGDGPDGPRVLINARWARGDTDALAIAPLVLRDLTYLEGAVGAAASEVEAREVEAAVCERLYAEILDGRPLADSAEADIPRACRDAGELLALPDPAGALRQAGYR